jgi:hypothetical protein
MRTITYRQFALVPRNMSYVAESIALCISSAIMKYEEKLAKEELAAQAQILCGKDDQRRTQFLRWLEDCQ